MARQNPISQRVSSWVRALLHREKVESELDAELRYDLERRTEANVRAGMDPKTAKHAAVREFGGLELAKEECRDARGTQILEQVGQDIRFALRTLAKRPGFTATAVLTLALGIGVNTSIFSLVYSLALRPLPVKDPAKVVSVFEEFRGHYSRGVYGSPSLLSYPEYVAFRENTHIFSGLAAFADDSLSLGGVSGQAVAGLLASCNYFDVLGRDMAVGRGLLAEDCHTPGEGSVAVISYGFWQSHFAGDAAVLGKTLTLNRRVFTVVGVAAANFGGTELQTPDVWLPITVAPHLLPDEFKNGNWLALDNVSWLNVVGRLKPGISHRRAEEELGFLALQRDANYPGRQTIVTVNSGAYLNGPEMRSVGAWVAAGILGLGGFILAIACINVMNLLLARALSRTQEIGVRLAMGASRMRLMRQLLTETILLALLGGAASVIVAQWLPSLLARSIPDLRLSAQVDLSMNLSILAYAFLASLVAALVCGLAPALQATKLDLVLSLKEEGLPLSSGRGRTRLRSLLIIAQVAGCTVLLVAAGLLARGLRHAESAGPGFLTRNVIVVSLDLANQGYNEARAAAFQRELRDRLAAIPGVVGVARSAVIPCVTGYMTVVTLPGGITDDSSQSVWGNIVSADYFQTMGIHLLRGRMFTEQEAQSPGATPAIISAAMARRFWGNADPLGKEFLAGKTPYQIFGIAPDVQNSHLGQTDGPFFYGASAPDIALDSKIFLRTTGDASEVGAAIRRLTHQLDATVMPSTESYEQMLKKILEPSRSIASLVAILGILAMVMAVVGVWGMVAYAASQRTHEIGIRKALGAQSRDILSLLLGNGARLSAMGLALGLALGAGVSRLLSAAGLLFGLSAFDPMTYLTIAAALAGVTLLACYLPARRAMRVDPLIALRYQ
ncbi:MAG TPA: ABC transporter permease [Candidatus Acidoferrales bacterium]|nr:ABC transporter permease [Candidatus Acidoferrales bacterium]